ncbi:MAG: hypothetical protein LBL04_17650 [Bacteroidales bacterium]|jgi:hypothetical protein|nr:hypothetical protein [Bacteroidales bacterium]
MQEIDLSENREEREAAENMSDDGKPVKRNRKAPKKRDGTVEVEGVAFERASNTFRERQKKFGTEEKASGNVRKAVKKIERKPRENDRSVTESDKPVRYRERRTGRDDRSFTDGGKPVKSRLRSGGTFGRREKKSKPGEKDFKGVKRFFKERDRTFKRKERSNNREGFVDRKLAGWSSDRDERFSKGSDRRKSSAPSKSADRKAKPPGNFKPGSKAQGKKVPVIVYGDPKAKPPKKSNRHSIPKSNKPV